MAPNVYPLTQGCLGKNQDNPQNQRLTDGATDREGLCHGPRSGLKRIRILTSKVTWTGAILILNRYLNPKNRTRLKTTSGPAEPTK